MSKVFVFNFQNKIQNLIDFYSSTFKILYKKDHVFLSWLQLSFYNYDKTN